MGTLVTLALLRRGSEAAISVEIQCSLFLSGRRNHCDGNQSAGPVEIMAQASWLIALPKDLRRAAATSVNPSILLREKGHSLDSQTKKLNFVLTEGSR